MSVGDGKASRPAPSKCVPAEKPDDDVAPGGGLHLEGHSALIPQAEDEIEAVVPAPVTEIDDLVSLVVFETAVADSEMRAYAGIRRPRDIPPVLTELIQE